MKVLGSVKNRYYIYILCVIIISSCYSNEKQQDGKSLSFSERIKLKQYKVQGKLLYTQYCANCHQADGSGLGKLIPPISASHRVKSDNSSVICIIKYGMEGAVEVNLEIAEISTFIGNSWKNSIGIVTSNEVEKALLVCN
jgi:cytochrome c551